MKMPMAARLKMGPNIYPGILPRPAAAAGTAEDAENRLRGFWAAILKLFPLVSLVWRIDDFFDAPETASLRRTGVALARSKA